MSNPHGNQPGFKQRENSLRLPRYRRDESEEDFLERMNEFLAEMEPTASEHSEEPLPLVIVLGLPRSGTTLLTQLLGHCLDVAVINNLAARFWLAPATGLCLARAVLGDKVQTGFQSDYGKTPHPSEPHEFSYFWQHWLKMENIPPYNPAQMENAIDWTGLRGALRNMTFVAGKPLVLKAPDVGYHLPRFANEVPESVFLLVRRDPVDTACSIYKGRLDYYNDEQAWQGQYPVEHDEIRDLSGKEQVAAQVHCLDRMFQRGLEAIPDGRSYVSDLPELCRSPSQIITSVQKLLNGQGFQLETRYDAPESFRENTHRGKGPYKEFESLLIQAHKRWPL